MSYELICRNVISDRIIFLTNNRIISWLAIITEVKHLLAGSSDAVGYVSEGAVPSCA